MKSKVFASVQREPRLHILFIGMLTATLTLSGCGKPEVSTTATESTAQTAEIDIKTIPAPKIFMDAGKQADFERLYETYKQFFVQPPVGTPVRIVRKNGLRVEGEMMRYTADGIAISTSDGISIIRRDDMTDETVSTLFADQFSRILAESTVNDGGRTPADIFKVPTDLSSKETRRFTADRMNPHIGPGRQFAQIDGVELFRGQSVFVVAETNGWICVKESADSDRVLGWLPKYASFVTNPENKDLIKREVETLIENGFLIDVNPARNEALVDLYEWRISDSASVEGMSRLLAFYCGHQKGSRLFWVDIKDALSGRRLAEYSESKGFRVY
ncbi:MAG TPA: hypothetical protein PJ991_09145 [Kiritimatiellia bacterium]|nr:hypothetical protein [Kiritimatiellia bacterium]